MVGGGRGEDSDGDSKAILCFQMKCKVETILFYVSSKQWVGPSNMLIYFKISYRLLPVLKQFFNNWIRCVCNPAQESNISFNGRT